MSAGTSTRSPSRSSSTLRPSRSSASRRRTASRLSVSGSPSPPARPQCRLDDRPVSGTPAQVSLQRHPPPRAWSGPGVLSHRGTERHHEARGTEAALACVALHHRLLHRVQALGCQVLHGHHVTAVGGGQRTDAGGSRGRIRVRRGRSVPIRTVQAPQSPSAHPSLVPASRMSGAQEIEQACRAVRHRCRQPPPSFSSSRISPSRGGHGSAATVGRVPVGREQQRDVVVRCRIADTEADRNDVEKRDVTRGLAGLPVVAPDNRTGSRSARASSPPLPAAAGPPCRLHWSPTAPAWCAGFPSIS